MSFASRWGILFVMVLLANRASSGIIVENLWYSFVWAVIVSGLNASIRTVVVFFQLQCTWLLMAIFAALLNLFLYSLLNLGVAASLGMMSNSIGSALFAALIVWASSTLCNHFIGFGGPDK